MFSSQSLILSQQQGYGQQTLLCHTSNKTSTAKRQVSNMTGTARRHNAEQEDKHSSTTSTRGHAQQQDKQSIANCEAVQLAGHEGDEPVLYQQTAVIPHSILVVPETTQQLGQK